jgi:putative endonuclease
MRTKDCTEREGCGAGARASAVTYSTSESVLVKYDSTMARSRFEFWVYILASSTGTLYVGVTNDIGARVAQHREHVGSRFTSTYTVHRLVHMERFQYVNNAIRREKELKGWSREKKVALIEETNPSWRDLSRDFGKQFKPDGVKW